MKNILILCIFLMEIAPAQAALKTAEELCNHPLANRAELISIPDQIKSMAFCQGALEIGARLAVTAGSLGVAAYEYSNAQKARLAEVEKNAQDRFKKLIAIETFEDAKNKRPLMTAEEIDKEIANLQKQLDVSLEREATPGKRQLRRVIDPKTGLGGENIIVEELKAEIAIYEKLKTLDAPHKPDFVRSETNWVVDSSKLSFDELPENAKTDYLKKAEAIILKYDTSGMNGKPLMAINSEVIARYSLKPTILAAAEEETPSIIKFFARNPRALVGLSVVGLADIAAFELAKKTILGSNVGCAGVNDKYLDLDEDCRVENKIGPHTAKILDMDKKERDELITSNRDVCLAQVDLRNSLYARPTVISNEVKCGRDGMDIPLSDNSHYKVVYYPNTENIKSITLLSKSYANAVSARTGKPSTRAELASFSEDGTYNNGIGDNTNVFVTANKIVPNVQQACDAPAELRQASLNDLGAATASLNTNNSSKTIN